MKEERLAIGGAVLAAIGTSLCCFGPLLFVVLGLGAFGAAAAFETARPYLLSAAVLLLGFGFYRVYFRRQPTCGPGEVCEAKPVSRASRIGLWIGTIAVLAFALSPYYAGHLASVIARRQQAARTTPATSQTLEIPNQNVGSQAAVIETVTVKVEGMTCTACEVPIRDALSRSEGVVSADVSHERGDARVKYDPTKTNVDQIKRAINSTGYKAK